MLDLGWFENSLRPDESSALPLIRKSLFQNLSSEHIPE
jgi:hypothetical protein